MFFTFLLCSKDSLESFVHIVFCTNHAVFIFTPQQSRKMLASSMKFMVFPINIHGFFPNKKTCALPPSLRSFLHSFSCHRLHLRHVHKANSECVFEGTQIRLTKSTNDGGWEFSCVSWFFYPLNIISRMSWKKNMGSVMGMVS